MLFSSIPFLYYFLPCVLFFYFIAPKRLKNSVLLLASLFFYFWGEPKYIFLMLISIFSGYLHGILIDHFRHTKAAKIFLISSIIVNLAFLCWFKYADFFISNFNAVFGLSIPLLKIALPIGISFYTFQILSYTIDVYRGQAAVQKNFLSLATYIALFPQLIAGPIVRYVDVAKDLENRTSSFAMISDGIRRFVIGLSKKVLIANVAGELCDVFRACEEKSILFYWIYAISFCLHVYFDFSGYSDMAIGLGKIFGFHFLENFNYPYISKSITEFWRRWHISLGSWFRDYVYIPLGGNRVKKGRWIFNILIVWLLTGFWHGAAWTFIIWGLFFAVLLTLEKLWLGKYLKNFPTAFQHLYVLFFVILSFVIFNANSLSQSFSDLSYMFGFGSLPLVTAQTLYYLRSYAVLLIIAVIGATPMVKQCVFRVRQHTIGLKVINLLEPIVLMSLLVMVTAYLVDGSFNPFLYFRF